MRILVAVVLALSVACLAPKIAASRPGQSMLQGAHADIATLPKTCRACHQGMRMAITGEEDSCLNCHGSGYARSYMLSKGYLKGPAELADIGAELQKPYRHPVLTVRNVHQQGEILPEESVNAPRHAECVDCHDPHLASRDNPYAGFSGKRIGNLVSEIDREYELCYRCHSDSRNLPGKATNKHAEFKTTNRSYHPVEGEGATEFIISLKEPYAARKERPGDISIISCSSCHGSDDPKGPRGPHGSNYEGLLKFNFDTRDGMTESETTYALCYECHDRNSILGDESFPHHSMHIAGKSRQGGTSCHTCHDAHGSARNPSLIRFNEDVVDPLPSGRIEFRTVAGNSRSGSCALVCHGVVHDDRTY